MFQKKIPMVTLEIFTFAGVMNLIRGAFRKFKESCCISVLNVSFAYEK